MKNIQTEMKSMGEVAWDRLTAEERATVRRELKNLSVPEKSDLATGRSLIIIRTIMERIGDWAHVVRNLPFADKTAYRRIKLYEKAKELWPDELIEAAIVREVTFVGCNDEKPMGFYEDIDSFTGRPTAQRIDEYLTNAAIQVRLRDTHFDNNVDSYERLKASFREVYRNLKGMPLSERKKFKEDLIGVIMPLFGATEPEMFKPRNIPDDFYPTARGAFERSPQARSRMAAAQSARWSRLKAVGN